MKKVLLSIGIVLSLFSCKVDKEIMSVDELTKWSTKSDTIFYSNQPVAVYDHFEYELNPSHGKDAKPIIELSIIQISFAVTTDELVKFIHTKHNRQKVEIVVPKHN